MHYLVLVLAMLFAAGPAYAADQIIPETGTNYQTTNTGLAVFEVSVPVPAGAKEIVGWTGRVQAGPGVRYVQINWLHNGGQLHWLDGQNFSGTEPATFVNATPWRFPAGTGHKLTNENDLVIGQFQCRMIDPAATPNCLGWATFYFRVP